jgi:integrase
LAQRQILDLQAESTKISYERYKRLYEESRGDTPHSEDFLLSFIADKAKCYAATTLWTMYSLLRKYLLLECSFDVGAGERIAHFLKTLTRHHLKKQAPAFTRDELFTYLRTAPSEGKSLINKLVLVVGFFGGLRSSEITALTWEDISFSSDGILVTIRRSKTDPAGIGAVKLLPKLDELLVSPVYYFSKYKSAVPLADPRGSTCLCPARTVLRDLTPPRAP